jgi:hypothetical protein
MTESEVLKAAMDLVGGRKRLEYGESTKANENIAVLYRAYLGERRGDTINNLDIALMGVLEKVARTKMGGHDRQHYVDMAGHSGVAGHIAEAREDEIKKIMKQSRAEALKASVPAKKPRRKARSPWHLSEEPLDEDNVTDS